MWYVCICCFVLCGCAVSRRYYIDVCYCDMFSVVNVYLHHLKFCVGQFHIREIKIENYEIELIYTRVWFSGAHQFTSSRTVSYFKM